MSLVGSAIADPTEPPLKLNSSVKGVVVFAGFEMQSRALNGTLCAVHHVPNVE